MDREKMREELITHICELINGGEVFKSTDIAIQQLLDREQFLTEQVKELEGENKHLDKINKQFYEEGGLLKGELQSLKDSIASAELPNEVLTCPLADGNCLYHKNVLEYVAKLKHKIGIQQRN